MVRWLLAVFTLQFLLGMGVSAYAHAAPVGPVAVVSYAAEAPAACDAAGQTSAPEAPDDSAGAGVGDFSSADLPDDQDFQHPGARPVALGFACPCLADPPHPSQPPRRHLRPPRA